MSNKLSQKEMEREIKYLQKENEEFQKVLFNNYNVKEGWENTVKVIAKELKLTQNEINLLLESDEDEK